jgi:hypothetical protein
LSSFAIDGSKPAVIAPSLVAGLLKATFGSEDASAIIALSIMRVVPVTFVPLTVYVPKS